MNDRQALAELMSSVCQACGKGKESMQSFCRACYFKLPKAERRSLYTHIHDGYAAIYAKAKAKLEGK